MIFSSNPVGTNATQATCTRSFQERVLSFPDLNLSCFYNVFIFKASNKVRVACSSNDRDNGHNSLKNKVRSYFLHFRCVFIGFMQ